MKQIRSISKQFSSLPNWLRHGLYGLLSYLLATTILLPFGKKCVMICIPYWSYPTLGVLEPLQNTMSFFSYEITVFLELILIVLVLLTYFFAGILIGWFVTTIKKLVNK